MEHSSVHYRLSARKLRTYLVQPLLLFSLLAGLILNTTSRTQAAPNAPDAISVTVYRDYNANGVKDALEPGVSNVTVTAYAASASGYSTPVVATGGANGVYSLATGAGAYRIEVTGLPAYLFDGAQGTTTTTFLSNGGSVTIGLANPGQYAPSTTVDLATAIHSGSVTYDASPVLVKFPETAGSNSTNEGDYDLPAATTLRGENQIGAIWGIANDRANGRLLVGAFVKRFARLAGNATTIYSVPYAGGSHTVWATVDATRVDPHGATPTWSEDFNVITSVGKDGLGDVDIAEDGREVYTIDLKTREFVRIPVNANGSAGTPVKVALPTTLANCPTASDARPFGMGVNDGKVYIGYVCSAESTVTGLPIDYWMTTHPGDRSKLFGYVYVWDSIATPTPTTASFTPVSGLNGFALTYTRGCINKDGVPVGDCANDRGNGAWSPWVPIYPFSSVPDTYGSQNYPQPILSDIEFDNGNMILGLSDRFTHMDGANALEPGISNIGGELTGAGDTLRACSNGVNTWVMEKLISGSATCDTAGLGFGNNADEVIDEYYHDDDYAVAGLELAGNHADVGEGGMVQVPGRSYMATTAYDPVRMVDWTLFDQGIHFYDNATGDFVRAYRLVNEDQPPNLIWGKGSGLGDMEALLAPAPLEIGNRLWCDNGVGGVGRSNGVQDAGEAVIPNATVTLQCDTNGTPTTYEATATTTTNASGLYLFKDNTGNITGANGWPAAVWNSAVRIIPRGAQCRVLVAPTQSAITSACGAGSTPTTANNGGADAGADLRDSDGTPNVDGAGNTGFVITATGDSGENNHTIDFGFLQSVDFGDAPDTAAGVGLGNYNTLGTDSGPNHVIVAGLRLGAIDPDSDNGLLQNAAATADDTTLTPDDEDGVATLPSITTLSTSVSLNVSVYSTSASTVACWIDFNRDGDFLDAGERASASVTASASQQTIPLTFSGFAAPAMGTSYLRCRISNTASEVTSPTGAATSGEVEDYQVSIALGQTGAIGNYVWVDENSDGYQDAGEPGIPNVTVQLKNCTTGAVLATTVTDTEGGYLFSGLAAGTYCVDVLESTLPTGMTQTTITTNPNTDFGNQNHSGNGYSVTIGGASPWENLTADFGYNYNPTTDVNTPPSGAVAALGDRVWIDVDSDGFQDANEVGIAGVTVQLYTAGADGVFGTADDVLAATTTTNAAGYYLFDGLAPGAYVVKVTPPSGYTQTGDPDHFGVTGTVNDNQTTTPVVLGPGDVFLDVDFGYVPPAAQNNTVGDTVWFDANASGTATMDAGEYGIPGVTVALIRDTNGNGMWDAGEPVIATDITDASGQYLFTGLPDGNYLVWVNDTDNVLGEMRQTYDSNGIATPDISAVALDPTGASSIGVSNLLQDFSYTAASQTTTSGSNGLIGDTVWFDLDNSGGATQGAGEPGIEGVVMQLLDASGTVLATTTTDENGHYLFGGLPVSVAGVQYQVKVAASNFAAGGALQGMAETYAAGAAVGGNQGNLVNLTTASPVNLAQDFSYTTTTTPGRIGNLVWLDSNADGVFATTAGQSTDPNAGADDDEPVIGGVTIDLYRDLNANGKVDAGEPRLSTQTTASAINATTYGADGVYIFSRLAAGTYVVNVTDTAGVLAGYWHSLGTAGVNNNSQIDPYAVTLAAGADNLTADFGYYVEPACVGNFVWYDQDGDGIQDATEPGLNSVTLQTVVSWPAGGATTLKTVSGDNPAQTGTQVGWYSFCNLLLDEDYRVGSSTSTPAANQPAHVVSVATAPTGYIPTLVSTDTGSTASSVLNDSNRHAGTVAVPVQGLTITTQQTASTEQVIASYDFGYRVADWGDLPDTYNTTSAASGAYHTIDATNPTPRLGTCVDAETNGVASGAASGDDGANSALDFGGACSDDEDGVQFVNSWIDGTGDVLVSVNGASACLNAWMDFANNSGAAVAGGDTTFGDSAGAISEWIIQNKVMAVGLNQLVTFPLPANLAAGNYYLRFRLTPNLGNTATCTDDVTAYAGGSATWAGAAKGGEVEDYVLNTAPLAVTLGNFQATMQGNAVLVTWETVSEVNNAGFTLYRSDSADGERVSLGFTPAAAPGATQGASYSVTDSDVVAGQTYYYWLEAMDVSGAASVYGPVSVSVGAPTAVTLAGLQAASGTTTPAWLVALGVVILGLGLLAVRQRRQA